MLPSLAGVLSVLAIFAILADGFEATVLPRRVTSRWRFTAWYFEYLWLPWRWAGQRLSRQRREGLYALFGPLSLLLLFAIWATVLITAFAGLHWARGSALKADAAVTFLDYLYLSGVTFFTLGYGDIIPVEPVGRLLAIAESGIGFGFLALLISYMPVLNTTFAQREIAVGLLDARAGSPPNGMRMLMRLAKARNIDGLQRYMEEWEEWCGRLLEDHLSYPVLGYYRSHHDNQSWLWMLACVLDTCAIALASFRGYQCYQAQITFAIARHAAVDLVMVFHTKPIQPKEDRMPRAQVAAFLDELSRQGVAVQNTDVVLDKLAGLRDMYEPFLCGMAQRFALPLPPVRYDGQTIDNWQTSAWMRRVAGIGRLTEVTEDDHWA